MPKDFSCRSGNLRVMSFSKIFQCKVVCFHCNSSRDLSYNDREEKQRPCASYDSEDLLGLCFQLMYCRVQLARFISSIFSCNDR